MEPMSAVSSPARQRSVVVLPQPLGPRRTRNSPGSISRSRSSIAIDDLDLEIEPGEFLVLLGPSGCGKTTTLRCLAGLETADIGSIAFGDKAVFDAARHLNVSPNKRGIGMVF